MECDVDTGTVIVLVPTGGSVVYSLDYDYENRYLYFSRTGLVPAIVRYANVYQLIMLIGENVFRI